MNAPAGTFRCQSLAKEIAAEAASKVRSESSMLAGQHVLKVVLSGANLEVQCLATRSHVASARKLHLWEAGQ